MCLTVSGLDRGGGSRLNEPTLLTPVWACKPLEIDLLSPWGLGDQKAEALKEPTRQKIRYNYNLKVSFIIIIIF